MYYDLDTLGSLSEELGFTSRKTSPDVLEVIIFDGVVLEFHNLRDSQDTLVGFNGTIMANRY